MDPISAIGVATTAYNAIKRGFQVGKEIEGMSKDLGRWMGAIQEVKEGHNKAKGRSFGSVEEEALEVLGKNKVMELVSRCKFNQQLELDKEQHQQHQEKILQEHQE